MTTTWVPSTTPARPVTGEQRDEKPVRFAPLGPDSLTWKYFGDLRTGMMGVWIGAIQNMYPELGAGVEEHSILLREPLQRVARSVYPIMGVVYDGNRAA
ncbi:MAG TPA: oxygenase MpaB family protein, partial [Mycobacterium sp.]|uniref:oxygenase MpaB family protein n=1 Tax=Mycobacterium sp. TaxID=1785 RepID=UPI002D3CCDB9